MAVAFKAAVAIGVGTSSSTTLVCTTNGAIAVDDLVVVRVATDNLSATTPTLTCTDSGGNTYVRHHGGAVNATAAAGVAGAIFATKATVAVNIGGTITITLSGAVAHKACFAQSFTGAENTVRSTAVSATGASTAAASPASGTVNAGDLVLGTVSAETRGALGADSDSLNGAWSGMTSQPSATSGSDATCVHVGGQFKIPTASGAQTYNSTIASTDWVASLIVLQASPDPAITQAAYQFFDDAGTEPSGPSLAAQDTPVVGNLANGDGFGMIRVRLQSTTAVAVPATDDWQLQWEKNASGSWTNIGTGAVIGYDNPNLTDGSVANSRLTGATGSWGTGRVSETGLVTDKGWSANGYVEFVYSVKLLAAQLAHNDVLRFRVLRNGVTTGMTYSSTPTINIKAPYDEKLRSIPVAATTTVVDTFTALPKAYKELVGEAYLVPSIGTVSTPDPLTSGFPTTGWTMVIKARGPQGSGLYIYASQNRGSPNRSWAVTRDDSGVSAFVGYTAGTDFPNTSVTYAGGIGLPDLVSPEYVAHQFNYVTGDSRVLESTNGGASYVETDYYNYGASSGPVPFNSADDITIGANGTGFDNVWDDRIYWIEMRTGMDPKAGTILWCYKASDYPGSGTSYVDPRGQTWTLTSAAAIVPAGMTITATATVTCTDTSSAFPSGAVGWFDASDASTFTYSSGAVVSQWRDKSGAGKHMVQATVGAQPIRSGTQNGKATVVFDGVDDVLMSVGPLTTAVDNITMFVAAVRTGGGATVDVEFYNGDSGANGYGPVFRSNNTNCGLLRGGSGWDSSSTPDPGRASYMTLQRSSGAWSLRVNGVLTSLATSTNPSAPTTSAQLGATVFGGAVFEAMMYDRVLSGAEITTVESYLATKWIPASTNYPETGRSITIAAATAVPTEKAGRKELALSITGAVATTITTALKDRELALSIPIAATTTTPTTRSGNKELARLLAIAATTTLPTTSAHYKEAGGGAPASPYLFAEDWNTADDTHWDWAKWPVQRPWCTISGNRGMVTGSGGPTVVASDKYVTDFEMLVKMTWDGANPGYPEICWRLYDGLGGYAASAGYCIQIHPGGTVNLLKIGAYATLGAGTVSVVDAALSAAGTRWFKVRVVGTSHKVKWWNDGAGEPGTWQLDGTDTVPQVDTQGAPVVGGTIGFRNYGSPPNYYVDDLTVTDLASPPLPTQDGSMRMLSNAKVITMGGASSVFPSDTDLTWCGWVKYSAYSGNAWDVWSTFSGGSTYCSTSVTPAGDLRQYMDTGDFTPGYNVPLNTWVFIAMSRSITGGTDVYWAPQGTSTLSTAHNASKGTVHGLKLRMLSGEYGSNPYSQGCAFKVWTAALTKTELEAEMATYAVQRTANLFLHYSMKNGLDYRPDNEPLNDQKWLWYEAGGFVSGPVATHLLDAPVAPSGAVGLALTSTVTFTGTDAPGANHFNETGRSILVAATTTGTDRAHFRNAAYFRVPSLLSYDFADTGTTVTDRSGSGRNGTLSGGASQTSGEMVISAAGHRLAYTPDAPALPTYASVTLKVRTSGFLTSHNIWTKMRVSNSSNFNLYCDGIRLAAVVRGTTVVGPSIIGTGPTIAINTTYQVALTYDGTTTRMYLNGVEAATATTATGPLDMTGADTTWNMGSTPLDTSTPIGATVYFDDARFFDYALTPAEVAYAAITPVIAGLADLSITSTATTTVVDTYHAGSIGNNETGRSIPIAGAVTATDLIHRKELALALPIAAATTLPTDRLNNKEPARSVPVVANVTVADAFGHLGNFSDLNLSIGNSGSVTVTDQADFHEPVLVLTAVGATTVTDRRGTRELALALPITASTTVTDRQGNKELALSIPAAVTVTATDLIHRKEIGLSITAAATTAVTDLLKLRELALSVPVAATTTVVDRSSYKQLLLPVGVAAAVTLTDAYSHLGNFSEINRLVPVTATTSMVEQADYHETALSVTGTATTTVTDSAKRRELILSTTAVGTTTLPVDQADLEEHPVSFSIVCFVNVTDLHGAPGHYDETQRSVLVTCTTTLPVDQADHHHVLGETVAATVTVTDIRRTYETQRSIPVAATTSVTDRLHLFDPTSVLVAATVDAVSQADYEDHPVSITTAATVTLTIESVGRHEPTMPIGISSTTNLTHRSSYRQLALPVGVSATTTMTDGLHAVMLFAVLVVAKIACTDFRSRSGIVLISDADALFLGDEEVDFVYAGADRAWP